MTKTNAMRLLEQAGISFTAQEYSYDENNLDGKLIPEKLGIPSEQIFKTLVTRGAGKNSIYVFCIPVSEELDLRKAAKAAGEKKIEMTHVKELLQLTGYIRGGCSPIGMKKKYPTFIDETAELNDFICVSAGVRGCQLMLSPADLIRYTEAEIFDLTE